jgi:molecular chaperone DnaK
MEVESKLASMVKNTQRSFLEYGGLLPKEAQESGEKVLSEAKAAIGTVDTGQIRMALEAVERLARQLTNAMMDQAAGSDSK